MVNVLCKVLFQPSHLSTDSTKDVSGQHNSFLFHQFLNRNWQFPLSRRHCARRGDVLQFGKLMIILSHCVLLYRETRDGNNLYQELSFTDNDALADIDEGADLTGGKQQQHAAHYWGSEYSDKYKCNIFCC